MWAVERYSRSFIIIKSRVESTKTGCAKARERGLILSDLESLASNTGGFDDGGGMLG